MVTNRVLTIVGVKDGVGTTTSLNLAAALTEAGHSVVAIEMAVPISNFVDYLDIPFTPGEDPSLHGALADTVDLPDVIYDAPGGMSVIPSAPVKETYEQTDLSRLPTVIDELRWSFDAIVIDTPAGLSDETTQSLAVADETIIISAPPQVASIQNGSAAIDLAQRQDAPVRGFLLNKSGTDASPSVDTITEAVDVNILGHVPVDDTVPRSQGHGEPVVPRAPNSAAAVAYKRVASGLLGEDQAATTDDDGQDGAGNRSPRDTATGDASDDPPSAPAADTNATETTAVDTVAESDITAPTDQEPKDTDRGTAEAADPERTPSDANDQADAPATTESDDDESLLAKVWRLFRPE